MDENAQEVVPLRRAVPSGCISGDGKLLNTTAPLRVAYIISAYKLPGQLIRLVTRLNTPTSRFLIHFDKKAHRALYRDAVDGLAGLSNVTFLERHRCEWGDFGHVRASIKGLTAIVRNRIPADYVVLLTGQDYPIKSNEQIAARLELARGQSFMQHRPMPAADWIGTAGRMEYWHVRLFGRELTLPLKHIGLRSLRHPSDWPAIALTAVLPRERSFVPGFKPFGGGGYWIFSRACAEQVVEVIERNPALVRFFKYVHVPDEHFFQTLILSALGDTGIINSDMRFTDWSKGGRSPAILRLGDVDRLAASPALFARKFDTTIDADVLDAIDRRLLFQHLEADQQA